MRLTIVIPAYNEEAAIASIIERSLAARQEIMDRSGVTGVEVVVVSDGSTDGTVRIAREYDEIRLIEFERNRGYGAAIKRGFAETDTELVGFLDADGTCDPRFFADLCLGLIVEQADIALGSRMGPQSKMPRLRRLGNRIYAGILSVLANRVVNDTASGMRVIRRDALQQLYPLPDGLNFTPAMSARALLDDSLSILELPMSYEERVGESKLNVLKDGWRFFQTILETTLFWRPARVFLGTAAVCAVVMVLLAAHPVEMWLTRGFLEESMIYRLLFCSFLGSIAALCTSALVVCESLHGFHRGSRRRRTFLQRMLEGVFSGRGVLGVSCGLTFVSALLVGEGVWTWLAEGKVYVHWSRVVLAGMLTFAMCQMVVTKVILVIVNMHVWRSRYTRSGSRGAAIGEPVQPSIPQAAKTPTVAARRSGEVVLT